MFTFTYSGIVISWLRHNANLLKMYVANRIIKITKNVSSEKLNYV